MEEDELDIELNEEQFRNDIGGVSKNPRAKEIAREEGVNIGTTRKENVLYLVIILLVIAVIVGIVAFLVLVNEDKFKDEIIIENKMNQTIESTTLNDFTFNSTTKNQFDNQFSFTFNIDEDLCETYCNQS